MIAKNILTLIACTVFALNTFAQSTPDSTSTSAEEKPEEPRKPHLDMMLVDVNWDYLIGMKDPVKQKWFGRAANVSFLYDHPLQKDGMVSGAIGVGFSSHHYYLNSTVNRLDTGGTPSAWFSPYGDSLKASKLNINYVDVPVEIRLRTKPNEKGDRWKLAIGGKVGYLINAHERVINDQNRKFKSYHYPDITQWRYGATFRIGYGSLMLNAFYSLTELFEEGRGVNPMNSLQIGLTVAPF